MQSEEIHDLKTLRISLYPHVCENETLVQLASLVYSAGAEGLWGFDACKKLRVDTKQLLYLVSQLEDCEAIVKVSNCVVPAALRTRVNTQSTSSSCLLFANEFYTGARGDGSTITDEDSDDTPEGKSTYLNGVRRLIVALCRSSGGMILDSSLYQAVVRDAGFSHQQLSKARRALVASRILERVSVSGQSSEDSCLGVQLIAGSSLSAISPVKEECDDSSARQLTATGETMARASLLKARSSLRSRLGCGVESVLCTLELLHSWGIPSATRRQIAQLLCLPKKPFEKLLEHVRDHKDCKSTLVSVGKRNFYVYSSTRKCEPLGSALARQPTVPCVQLVSAYSRPDTPTSGKPGMAITSSGVRRASIIRKLVLEMEAVSVAVLCRLVEDEEVKMGHPRVSIDRRSILRILEGVSEVAVCDKAKTLPGSMEQLLIVYNPQKIDAITACQRIRRPQGMTGLKSPVKEEDSESWTGHSAMPSLTSSDSIGAATSTAATASGFQTLVVRPETLPSFSRVKQIVIEGEIESLLVKGRGAFEKLTAGERIALGGKPTSASLRGNHITQAQADANALGNGFVRHEYCRAKMLHEFLVLEFGTAKFSVRSALLQMPVRLFASCVGCFGIAPETPADPSWSSTLHAVCETRIRDLKRDLQDKLLRPQVDSRKKSPDVSFCRSLATLVRLGVARMHIPDTRVGNRNSWETTYILVPSVAIDSELVSRRGSSRVFNVCDSSADLRDYWLTLRVTYTTGKSSKQWSSLKHIEDPVVSIDEASTLCRYLDQCLRNVSSFSGSEILIVDSDTDSLMQVCVASNIDIDIALTYLKSRHRALKLVASDALGGNTNSLHASRTALKALSRVLILDKDSVHFQCLECIAFHTTSRNLLTRHLKETHGIEVSSLTPYVVQKASGGRRANAKSSSTASTEDDDDQVAESLNDHAVRIVRTLASGFSSNLAKSKGVRSLPSNELLGLVMDDMDISSGAAVRQALETQTDLAHGENPISRSRDEGSQNLTALNSIAIADLVAHQEGLTDSRLTDQSLWDSLCLSTVRSAAPPGSLFDLVSVQASHFRYKGDKLKLAKIGREALFGSWTAERDLAATAGVQQNAATCVALIASGQIPVEDSTLISEADPDVRMTHATQPDSPSSSDSDSSSSDSLSLDEFDSPSHASVGGLSLSASHDASVSGGRLHVSSLKETYVKPLSAVSHLMDQNLVNYGLQSLPKSLFEQRLVHAIVHSRLQWRPAGIVIPDVSTLMLPRDSPSPVVAAGQSLLVKTNLKGTHGDSIEVQFSEFWKYKSAIESGSFFLDMITMEPDRYSSGDSSVRLVSKLRDECFLNTGSNSRETDIDLSEAASAFPRWFVKSFFERPTIRASWVAPWGPSPHQVSVVFQILAGLVAAIHAHPAVTVRRLANMTGLPQAEVVVLLHVLTEQSKLVTYRQVEGSLWFFINS